MIKILLLDENDRAKSVINKKKIELSDFREDVYQEIKKCDITIYKSKNHKEILLSRLSELETDNILKNI